MLDAIFVIDTYSLKLSLSSAATAAAAEANVTDVLQAQIVTLNYTIRQMQQTISQLEMRLAQTETMRFAALGVAIKTSAATPIKTWGARSGT